MPILKKRKFEDAEKGLKHFSWQQPLFSNITALYLRQTPRAKEAPAY